MRDDGDNVDVGEEESGEKQRGGPRRRERDRHRGRERQEERDHDDDGDRERDDDVDEFQLLLTVLSVVVVARKVPFVSLSVLSVRWWTLDVTSKQYALAPTAVAVGDAQRTAGDSHRPYPR